MLRIRRWLRGVQIRVRAQSTMISRRIESKDMIRLYRIGTVQAYAAMCLGPGDSSSELRGLERSRMLQSASSHLTFQEYEHAGFLT
jgi:hypothetical protein